jgi:hypothetical protein
VWEARSHFQCRLRLGLDRSMLFPPDLVPYLKEALSGHPALEGLADGVFAELLTLVFFSSLETEEGEYPPIRVVFSARGGDEPPPSGKWGILRWTLLDFREPQPFLHVAWTAGHLEVVGLARRGFGTDDSTFLEIVATAPGHLDVWSGRTRVLEYAQGSLIPPPEKVILGEGPVQQSLRRAAERAGVSAQGWQFYIDAIATIIRVMAAHGQGGILAITDQPGIHAESGILTAVSPSLLVLLNQLAETRISDSVVGGAPAARGALRVDAVLEAALRSEINRASLEIGGLTALDGATVLDAELAVRAFGVILPTAPQVDVLEGFNSEPGAVSSFPIAQRGARHRAAAVLAHHRPDSLVFIASSDGDVGCMLRAPGSDSVVMWRFMRRAS